MKKTITPQDNTRLPRGFSYSARTVREKTPRRTPPAEADLDGRVYAAGAAVADALDQAGDGIVRLGYAVQRAGERVGRKAEKLAMYIAAANELAGEE